MVNNNSKNVLLTELRADLELLLECIKCQINSPAAVKQALVTIASMCTTQGLLHLEIEFASKTTKNKYIFQHKLYHFSRAKMIRIVNRNFLLH